MSKIGIISDIHGNFPALREVISKLKEEKCEKIVSLGDIAGYYSMINECIELLLKEHIYSLKGNHDSYILGESFCPRSYSVSVCITYQQKIIRTEYLDWLRTLKSTAKLKNIYAMHGGFRDSIDEYVNEFDFHKAHSYFPEYKFFLSGHTHVQSIQQREDITYCNPGSVGQPRDFDNRAAYAVLDDGKITTYRVGYPIDEIAENMRKAGFEDYYYRNLYKGCKIGDV